MKPLAFNFSLLTQHQLIPYWFPCITKCAPRTLPLHSANRHWTGRAHVLLYSFLVGYLNQKLDILFICLALIFLKSKISKVAQPRKLRQQKDLRGHTRGTCMERGTAAHSDTSRNMMLFPLYLCAPKRFMIVCLLWKCLVLPQKKKDLSRPGCQSFGYCNV